jgi:hypothetical protein
MKALNLLSRRMALPDAQQYLTLYLGALLLALIASWPTQGDSPNDVWFSLAYTRAAGLGLLGLGYGVSARPGRSDQLLTASMLACFALLALPLEVAAYAASYPATPLSWVLAVPALSVLAMFAVGLPIGRLLRAIRLESLAPLAVPGLLAGMFAFDLAADINLLNPITAAVRVSPLHLTVLVVAVTGLAFALLLPPRKRP